MELTKEEKVRDLITTFAPIVGIDDEKAIEDVIKRFSSYNDETIVVEAVKSLARFHQAGMIDIEDVSDNVEKILCIAPDKYSSMEDLIDMLRDLRKKNLDNQQVPLEENHRQVIEAFYKFNELLENQYFDCFYTGGLMGYLITDTLLQRYHGDLDMMFNEEQLRALQKVIEQSKDFTLETHMDTKDETGHEFAIRYKDSPMSVGLFLFSRDRTGAITNKSYYIDRNTGEMKCDEVEHTLAYSEMAYDDSERMYHGHSFTMLSMEDMYISKRGSSRPKDGYDADLIEDMVDQDACKRLDEERKKVDKRTVGVHGGVVHEMTSELLQSRKK